MAVSRSCRWGCRWRRSALAEVVRPGMGCLGLLAAAGAVGVAGAVEPDRQCGGGGQIQGVEVYVWHAPVEADRFVGDRQGQGDGDLGGDDAELAGGNRDAGLAAAVDECRAAVFAAEPTA